MRRITIFVSLTVACGTAALISGCQNSQTLARVTKQLTTPEGGKPYVVATEKTAFYRYGPQQGNGPDMELPKDTVVNLIRSSFGYSKVRLASTGEQGFVAMEDIMRASPTLLASLTKPPEHLPSTTPSSDSSAENFDLRSTDASFVPPPEDLPPPDLPPEASEPPPQ